MRTYPRTQEAFERIRGDLRLHSKASSWDVSLNYRQAQSGDTRGPARPRPRPASSGRGFSARRALAHPRARSEPRNRIGSSRFPLIIPMGQIVHSDVGWHRISLFELAGLRNVYASCFGKISARLSIYIYIYTQFFEKYFSGKPH